MMQMFAEGSIGEAPQVQ